MLLAVDIHPIVGQLLCYDLKLGCSVGYQLSHLLQYLIHRSAHVLASDDRNGAIGTMAVASLAYLKIGIMSWSGDMPHYIACIHRRAKVSKQLLVVELAIKLVHLGYLSLKFLLVSL